MSMLIALALALIVAAPAVAAAAEPTPSPASRGPLQTPAEEEYGKGMRAKRAKEWSVAVASFQKATELKPDFPEAWSELGYALRNVGNYPQSVKAYDEALRLKPRFPEALEYLGEAYVKMGRTADAQRILDRLRPLDAGRAQELAEEIKKGR